jgi:hypothetical protein
MDDIGCNHYFESEKEILEYGLRRVRNMGAIKWRPADKVWIRLTDPMFKNKTLFLGEEYTALNAVDMVVATACNKFRHEAITEKTLPSWDENSNKAAIAAAVEQFLTAKRAKHKLPVSKYPQNGEDLLPKLWRVASGMGSNLRPEGGQFTDVERKCFPIIVFAGGWDELRSSLDWL